MAAANFTSTYSIFLSMCKDDLFLFQLKKIQKARSLTTCLNAIEDSQVASSSLVDTSFIVMPIFGHKSFFHLPRFH